MSTRSRWNRFVALIAALLLMVMGTPPSAAQTMEEAGAAYARGDHATALQGFRIHAGRSDAEAQFMLGLMYDKGEGVPQNYAEALRWYRRAAEQGDARAQVNVGLMYEDGAGVPKTSFKHTSGATSLPPAPRRRTRTFARRPSVLVIGSRRG